MAKFSVSEAEARLRENEKQFRKEYSQMRDVAQKRLKRMEEAGLQSKAYKSHREGFSKLKDIDKRDLAKAYSELSKFVSAKSGSLSGQHAIRRKTIETWQEHGIDLNERNYDKTMQILEEMRRQKIVYGSDKVVELADQMLELDDQQTQDWMDHLDTLLQHTEELQEIEDVAGYDFEEIIRMIGG